MTDLIRAKAPDMERYPDFRSCLRDYQRSACEKIEKAPKAFLVYHSMGLGKTYIAACLALEEIWRGGTPVIVLQTAILNNLISIMISIIHRLQLCEGVDDEKLFDQLRDRMTHFTGSAKEPEINLKGRIVIIDEVHNLYRGVMNRARTQLRIYDKILEEDNCKIVMFSGTPISHSAREMVAMCNLLTGKKLYRGVEIRPDGEVLMVSADRKRRMIKPLREIVAGLIDYLSYDESSFGDRVARMNPMVEVKVEMSPDQYESYLISEEVERNYRDKQRHLRIEGRRDYIPFYCGSRVTGNHDESSEFPSPKFVAIHKAVEEACGRGELGLVYSQFDARSGMSTFGDFLVGKGWRKFDLRRKLTETPPGSFTFAILTGTTTPRNRHRIVELFNSPENARGKFINLIITTKVTSEGVTLRNGRHIHIMEPYWNMTLIHQLVHRMMRVDSHQDLPPEDRVVDTYIYLAVAPADRVASRQQKSTIDQQILGSALTLEQETLQVLRILQAASSE